MERDYRQELLGAIERADRPGAAAVIDAWAVGRQLWRVVPDLLTPTLETFGELWTQGQGGVSLATGYVASKIAEDVLARLLELKRAEPGHAFPEKGRVLLGNVEDDYHPLGRTMVAAFLRTEGWEVHDLGVDVDAATFLDQAEALGARVIGVSAMMYTTAKNVARVRAEIDRRGFKGRIQLAVGGAVFKLRPELVAEFGGDGTAASAVEANALFNRLWQRALACGPAPGEVCP